MNRNPLTGTAMAALGLLTLLFAGCTDTSTNPLPSGDPSDPAFQFVEGEVADQAFDGVDLSLGFSTALVDAIPAPAGVRRATSVRSAAYSDVIFDSVHYTYTNQWHVFDFWGYAVSESLLDTVAVDGIDSIQILAAGTPLQYPDETMDQLRYRITFDAANYAGTATRTGIHRIDLGRPDPFSEVTTIDGTAQELFSFAHQTDSGSCEVTVNLDFAAENVVMDFATGECPQSGTVSLAFSLSADCTGGGLTLSVDGNWAVIGHYTEAGGTFTYSDGEHVWTGIDSCSSGGVQAIAPLR